MADQPALAATVAEAMAQKSWLKPMSESADLDIALLLCDCLDKPRSFLYSWPEYVLSAEQAQRFHKLLCRRYAGEPVAHILGHREFWSLDLAVSNTTLIPRPDTECLVEKALALIGESGLENGVLLDLGAGSGAIALALASELPNWQVQGAELHPEALALAEGNRRRLGFQNVHFYASNWFQSVPMQAFDLIVSNPPYIDAVDPHLQQGDVRFEPHSALVAADQGLADLYEIIRDATRYLRAGAFLLLEHGYQQATLVRRELTAQGYTSVDSGRDYGGHERISWGCWHAE
ncbi:MAG: peptide chain release factor N(5)-glutamine methyltransferase [Spongiibacteraceae bacterium]